MAGLKNFWKDAEIFYFTTERVQERPEGQETRTSAENSSSPMSEPSRGSSSGSPYSMSNIRTRSANETCNSPSEVASVNPSSETDSTRQSAVNQKRPGMDPASWRDARCARHPDNKVWSSEELIRMVRSDRMLCPGCIEAATKRSMAKPARPEA